jgi:hypothetical protein
MESFQERKDTLKRHVSRLPSGTFPPFLRAQLLPLSLSGSRFPPCLLGIGAHPIPICAAVQLVRRRGVASSAAAEPLYCRHGSGLARCAHAACWRVPKPLDNTCKLTCVCSRSYIRGEVGHKDSPVLSGRDPSGVRTYARVIVIGTQVIDLRIIYRLVCEGEIARKKA